MTLITSTLIDHIATTCTDNILDSDVHKVALSDHYMVFCNRTLDSAVSGSHKMIVARNMKNFNQEAFLADFACFCWETVVNKFSYANGMIRKYSSYFQPLYISMPL